MISDITFEDIEMVRQWFESPTEIISNGQNVNILWSGGLDSTFLLLTLLIKGYTVRSYHVELQNNHPKNEKEADAREEITNTLHDHYPDIVKLWINKVAPEQSFLVPSKQRPDIKQALYWLVSTQVDNAFTSYCIAYVNGDDAIYYIPAMKKVIEGLNMMSTHCKVDVYFPMVNVKKSWFFTSMPEVVTSKLYWCEMGNVEENCPCPACKRHKNEIGN